MDEPGTDCINSRRRLANVPQGLKPQVLCGYCGTTEVVPFRGTIYATSSNAAIQETAYQCWWTNGPIGY
jgi:hypothetical protein